MTGIPLIIAFFIMIVVMIVAISKFKIHPFLSIMGVSLILALLALPLGLLICASTVLVKQHSILDVFVAIPVSAVLYFIVYHRAFRKKRKHA